MLYFALQLLLCKGFIFLYICDGYGDGYDDGLLQYHNYIIIYKLVASFVLQCANLFTCLDSFLKIWKVCMISKKIISEMFVNIEFPKVLPSENFPL